jgi:hypothetical protein
MRWSRTAAREAMIDRPKLIYLARRNPSIEQADFTARWRRHGELGMSLPRWRNIWRYAQCDARPWDAAPLPLAAGYDGVGLVWYRSAAARASHVDDAGRAVMANDEFETFDRPVRDGSFVTGEIVLRPQPCDGLKLFCFLFARPDAAPETVARHLEGPRTALLTGALRTAGAGAGYILNVARTDGTLGNAGLGCAAVDEIGFESIAVAEKFLTPGLVASLAACQDSVIARMTAVLTRETVLYQVEQPPSAMPGAAE